MLDFRQSVVEFYRVCFVHAGVSGGVLEKLADGPMSAETLSEQLGITNQEGLRAWLDLGVGLAELELGPRGYSLSSELSKGIVEPDNDPYRAVLEEVAVHHYQHIVQTLPVLSDNRQFGFDASIGELVARSSRLSEPLIRGFMDEVIPRTGPFSLLEVGCGSGAYVKYACELNESLVATGLEMQPAVADFARNNVDQWGIAERASIEVGDVRDFESDRRFDLVTLHQNIYYFANDERPALLRKLHGFINPGGTLLVTSACKGGSPLFRVLDLWFSTSEGLAPLPDPEELKAQLVAAGFSEVLVRKPIPDESFHGFVARKGDE